MGLSFPAQTFQKLSPGSYLLRHLQSTEPTRPSARAPEAFRAPSLHTNSLSHAQGSAVVRTGDTAVVCGVRGEILGLTHGEGRTKGKIDVHRNVSDGTTGKLDVDEEIKTHSLLVPNLELGTGCSRDYHPGPPSDFAQAVAERLRSLLLDTATLIPASTLRICDVEGETKAYWVLYIDIVCISLDGNVLDTAWAAVVAALRSTRLPRAIWDADKEMVVCDPNPAAYRALEMREPVFVASFCVFENEGEEEEGGKQRWVLSDPDEFEESVCVERVLVCVSEGGKIKRIEKSGGLTNVVEVLPVCIKRAKERYETWVKMLG
ncbi:ribosomal protein S5 domain 2-type protein [Tricharina praecox]|uniref:ribosomal protein S5 domain 2-type protein n=1 Tax=Tricharina praecox TaxID=43433 RepID=UPI00221FFA40|nr:ribosomal protein S5 domain 2-type protein [Tricharina praecox]KAI5857156.1 ribosomal protein S5 domain 2-type protein [Tricharina praecox]